MKKNIKQEEKSKTRINISISIFFVWLLTNVRRASVFHLLLLVHFTDWTNHSHLSWAARKYSLKNVTWFFYIILLCLMKKWWNSVSSFNKTCVFFAPSFCNIFVNCVVLSKSATVVHILAKEICQIKIPHTHGRHKENTYTDLKISLYVLSNIKMIRRKFCILNPKDFWALP